MDVAIWLGALRRGRPGTTNFRGLAIDFRGSLQQRLRPDAVCPAYLDVLQTLTAPRERRKKCHLLFVLMICAF